MNRTIPEPLFILEMANNHMGDVDHGIRVIRAMGEVTRKFNFRCAFKLQYRDLDTFIHPAKKGRDDIKYVKRFAETRLSQDQFQRLVDEMRANGFLPMATPFDEPSVDLIESQKLAIVKIASCSFTDWPLLERVVSTDLPIIASTAGASIDEIDRVVSFFVHRNKEFAILHCVGEYPTPDDHMNLSQIDFLKARYPGVRIGFSTHENPDNFDMVKLAVAKGASVFEKHVGLPTEAYPLNAYSASPAQVEKWLAAAQTAFTLCGRGERRVDTNPVEAASLRSLRRGVFARRQVHAGEVVQQNDVYFAFPPEDGQITANDWSKYALCSATTDIAPDEALTHQNANLPDQQKKVLHIVQSVRKMLQESGITFPGCTNLEISHHYGIDRFWEEGLSMLTVVNRAYCKKLLIVMPRQNHPEQYHREKEETFHVLYGSIQLALDGVLQTCKPGDVITVDPRVRHAFTSSEGAIIEEISSTHCKNDSFYTDPAIGENLNRKTLISFWME
jgi:sialic acid synthase SpsE/mannose-6-phosphate isomerase-like protein (cupin superfamily)